MAHLLIVALLAGMCAAVLFSYECLGITARTRIQKQTRQRLGVDEQAHAHAQSGGFLARVSRALSGRRKEEKRRTASFERDLPALLEVVALCMQAGMGFDQSFALYTERFDTPLARCCREELNIWQKGLESREEGMRRLAERVNTASFRHFCSSVLRALRFGAPMTQLLLDLAREARKEYRAKRQELVAKAPVKMLLPTGALILPAMLLLVMGPIILDLMRKMG
jgi:tight adherence protein C